MINRSKNNIFSKIKDSENHFIINVLSRNADLLDSKNCELYNSDNINISEFTEKNYIIDEDKEKKIFKDHYLDFLDERENDETQVFFVPWYLCNFNCNYCYQSAYSNSVQRPENINTVINAFFDYIKIFNKKYITLFGGEPLLTDEYSYNTIQYFLNTATKNKLDTAIVTNGYNLVDYIDLFKTASIREIQVTLDGAVNTHNYRRPLKDGSATFNRIVEGIDKALAENFVINLRLVLDRENISELRKISEFAVNKGWTKLDNFKTQIGRNYELHSCQENSKRLYTRLQIQEAIYNEITKFPIIEEFYQPSFSISKYLYQNGQLPEPLFDSCPGCKTEWAFDYTGRIYSCTATVGKEEEQVGLFYPKKYLNEEIISLWQERDITSIEDCKNCNLALICGGGCAAVAKNKTGKILSPDCRPVKEILEIGFKYYFIDKQGEENV